MAVYCTLPPTHFWFTSIIVYRPLIFSTSKLSLVSSAFCLRHIAYKALLYIFLIALRFDDSSQSNVMAFPQSHDPRHCGGWCG